MVEGGERNLANEAVAEDRHLLGVILRGQLIHRISFGAVDCPADPLLPALRRGVPDPLRWICTGLTHRCASGIAEGAPATRPLDVDHATIMAPAKALSVKSAPS